MTDEISTRLALPFLAGGQMQKHVTVNAALSRLDALLHLGVVSRTRTAQPADPDEGQAWLIPPAATGAAWSAMAAGALATWQDGAWLELTPPLGAVAFVLDEAQAVVRTAGGWAPLGSLLGRIDSVERLGIGTSPDAANPFAARLNAALLAARQVSTGGTGDVRLTLSKEAVGDVASLLLQTAFGGRAEIGLIGDDALSMKVSPDGAAWSEALRVDPSTGRVTFPRGAVRRETTVFTASGAYAPPGWATSVEALVIAGGGGGGGGQGAAAGTQRKGGGGGGAGGQVRAVWPIAALAGSVTVTIGSGGAAGPTDADGIDGGVSKIDLAGVTLLRASGGGGGRAGGEAGAGGLGSAFGNGGGAALDAATGTDGGSSADPTGPGGGGGGGSVTAANVAHPGGAGGAGALAAVLASGGVGGASAGSVGASAPLSDVSRAGGGGGGGGGSSAGVGHAGGAGGQWGAGGGGGGGGLTTGGSGGSGAAGVVVMTAVG